MLKTFGAFPDIAGSEKGLAVVCGSGRCLWDDLESLGEHEGKIIAVNWAGLFIPQEVHHWYSDESEGLFHWCQLRYKFPRGCHQQPAIAHTAKDYPHMENVWPWPLQGTSSLGAVYTGLALGFDEIVLCGVPLDDKGHFYDPPDVKTNFTNVVPDRDGELRFWRDAKQRFFDGKVTSMSGRTRDLLGSP